MEPIYPEHSDTSGGMNMHVPPTESNTGKNPNTGIDFVERVESTEALIDPTGSDKEGVNVDSQPLIGENVVGEKKDGESGKVSRDGEAVIPNVKDTSGETSYKSARTHSSTEPTVAEVLAGLKNVGVVTEKGESEDDVVIVSSTASRRRTKSYVAAFEKKKTILGLGENVDNPMEPSEDVDLEEMKRKAKENKKIKKGQGKAKRSSDDHISGSVSKKRKGVVISEPKIPTRGDKFVVDDVAESDEEGAIKAHRERSKGKMKINDNRNMINNRRISKDVDDVPTDGVDFCSEEHKARWKYVCVRNILPERFSFALIKKHYGTQNKGITRATLKHGNIIGELIGKALTTWPTKGSFQNWCQAEANWIPKLDLQHAYHSASTCSQEKNGLREDAKSLTISAKLMKRKHVIDVEFNAVDHTELVPEGDAARMLIKLYEEE
ncbi:hypothetical protein LIER_39785 [Lithospermum erythrorhizon]|uniref:Uncharacterized protein n=1 Tax=Lithospermum erythrorhizon TaxID=34254 RepID=A0AAV3QMI6_LITER